MILTSIYAIFHVLFQFPASILVEKIGLKKSLVLGNFSWVVSMFFVIFAPNFQIFIFAEFFSAIGTALKALTETQILYASLKISGTRKNFGKIEGGAVAGYYFIEAFSCAFIGAVFELNNYIPVIMTLTVLIISFVTSLFFDEVEGQTESKINIKEYLTDFKKTMKSKRLNAMYMYVILISGLISVMDTLQKDAIVSLNVSAMEYSYIFAVLMLCIGLGSKVQYVVEKIRKRKTLTVSGYICTAVPLLIGIILICFKDYRQFSLVMCILLLVLENLNYGIYRISVKKYLNNFTTHKVRGKIIAVFYICEGVGKAVFLAICGALADYSGTNITLLIIGLATIVILSIILKYMNKHLGLDPEMYDAIDIFGTDISKEKKEEKSLNMNEVLTEMSEVKNKINK